ncbi:MAG: IS21-like element helper ATPase IstB [Nitrospiraceae bacterium]|jgi:DNA replication protein DnaC|uniref:IstB domain protein ATP-binding protein n=1 Tax=Leptospirillum ferriphilum (strain ML-04) TaxID=1048260 RepID=J9ZEN8_LEPFM|nr:IS21-like element helper ATPase IstB [Leptospirillum ferriphilum]AFS54641.1 IstB domain protein ATP-binding protein [Leptospirillum ferriphilum ML-04]MDA8111015.1 IS21-like element helper ATPase IstB [Nitrospiraceae bacterium]
MSLPQTRTLLAELKLSGSLARLDQILEDARTQQWTPEEVLDALLQSEQDHRRLRATQKRMKSSRIKQPSSFEDLDKSAPRSLTRTEIVEIQSLAWLSEGRPLVLVGQTGVGKTYLAQAVGNKACAYGYTVLYLSVTHWMEQRHQARITGSLLKFRESLIRPQLLIMDDFGMKKWTSEEAEDFRELLEERSCGKSVLITTQLPYDHWPEVIGDPVLLEAIVDRLEGPALTIRITGESYRKIRARQRDKNGKTAPSAPTPG